MNARPLLGLLAVTLLGSPVAAQQKSKTKEPSFEGRPLSSWVKDLQAQAPQTRNAAAYAISGMGPDAASAVPALIEALDDLEPVVRFPVEVALREIGPAAKAALPKLKELLDDRNEDVAAMARKAIEAISGEKVETERD
jgi:HEAT repeat protein